VRRAEILGNIGAETLRMGRLVDDLLLLARADEQGLQLRMTEVDVDDLVEAEVRRLRLTGQVAVTWWSEPVRVIGDRDRLAQVLRNLTENAERYAVSRVHLDLRRVGLQAVLNVEDDGPGIPAESRTRVFDRFARLDASRQRSSGGAGLGLAIVREIVAGHHGTVLLELSGLGGTAAQVRLPAVGLPPED
jgi:signal transduction histidine kinase